MALILRRVRSGDEPALARVHTLGWRQGYAGLMPDGFLAQRTVGPAAWSARLAKAPVRSAHFVAEVGGETVGFAGVGPAMEAAEPAGTELGQLYTLYVLAEHWGAGIGHQLHSAGMDALRAEGFRAAMLWVLDANARAIAFYERQGWRAQDCWQEETLAGFTIQEQRFHVDLDLGR